MAVPSALLYVPPKFLDEKGIPFTLRPTTARQYLSPFYSSSDSEALGLIGVRTLSDRDFLVHLQAMIESNPRIMQSRPCTWHAQLSKALLLLFGNIELRTMISKMKLIPLRDGTWTQAAD